MNTIALIQHRRWSAALVLFVVICWLRVDMAHAQEVDPTPAETAVLVGFASTATPAQKAALLRRLDHAPARWLQPLNVLRIPVSATEAPALVQRIKQFTGADAAVAFVEMDGPVQGMEMPNDPDLEDTYKMYTPQVLNLIDAWEITTGSPDVVIAVLDSGITVEHPEFTDKYLQGYDFFNDDDEPLDDHGHGTHVSGIAAAAINNREGAAGVCGDCRILPVKVLNENNAGVWSDVAAGIIYATDQNADIIVMSLGSSTGSQAVESALAYALEHDVLIVAAAGNANSNSPFYPAAYPDVIAVAATDAQDERWTLSNYGDYIDISAPGSSIYATYNDLDNAYGGYAFMSGTSMATPHVAGVLALLLSQEPARTPAEVKDILFSTAKDLGQPGWDPFFGHGRIDPLEALLAESDDPRTASLSGTIWEDIDRDGVMDGDEEARIADVRIQIHRAGQSSPMTTAYSDSDGRWRVEQLPGGAYDIQIFDDQFYVHTSPPIISVQLDIAQHLDGINFGVSRARAADGPDDDKQSYYTFVPIIATEKARGLR